MANLSSVQYGVVSLDVVSDEIRRVLGDRTPQLVIEQKDPESILVFGFDTLDAQILLNFAEEHKLYGAIQLGENSHSKQSSFDLVLSRREISIELPDINGKKTYEFPNELRVSQVLSTINEIPLSDVQVVVSPRAPRAKL